MSASKCLVVALHVSCVGALLLPSSDRERQPTAAIPRFEQFWQASGRSYRLGSAEYEMRRSLYEQRAAAAVHQNSQSGALWTAGVNFLWDMTEEEFAELRGYRHGARPGHDGEGVSEERLGFLQGGNPSQGGIQSNATKTTHTPLPKEKSWGNLTTFGEVVNQGACGSCWAIAASRVLQSHAEIHMKSVRTFSAQQLVSCVPNPQECGGQGGCQGATVELAYAWVMNHGLATNSQVPYWANNSNCTIPQTVSLANAKSSKSPTVSGAASFGMTGWTRLAENKYEPLARALVEFGPVAVSASARHWGLYQAGIFNGCPKDTVVDHAVVLFAFGQVTNTTANTTTKFWHIQNSWGSTWGESGTIRLLRHDVEGEYCGINDSPEMGTGCVGGPPEVPVCGMCGILFDSVVPFF